MFRLALAAAVLTLVLVVGTAGARTEANVYSVQNLVSDTASTAPTTDPSLVNGWGLSAGPTTPWWTSNNGTNTSTLYSGAGAKVALTVAVPGGPTGTVYNGTAADFVVSQSGKSGSAQVPVRDRGRDDPRLVADRERGHGHPRRRPLDAGGGLQGPRPR